MVDYNPTTPKAHQDDFQSKEPHFSSIKPPLAFIDNEKRDRWSKHIYPRVNQEIAWQDILLKLCPTYTTANQAPQPPEMNKSRGHESDYCNYLNILSASFTNGGSCTYFICHFSLLDPQYLTPSASGCADQNLRWLTQSLWL
jgi:hypothetical protein